MFLSNVKNKKEIFSWSLYDFANQPFSTIIVTFIYSTLFTTSICTQDGEKIWGSAIAITSILVALFSPIFGALSDKGGYRKFFLIFFTCICAIFSMLLYFPKEGDVYLAVTCFIIANVAFEMGHVFCNSYLPDISSKENIGRISGFAWGIGFLGGLIALFVSLLLFDVNNSYNSYEETRRINIFVGLWFLCFSLPTFIYVNDKRKERITRNHIIDSFQSIKNTFQQVKEYRQIVKFLIARLFYNDALITIFAFGGPYAKKTLDFSMNEVFLFGIVLSISAGIGSFVFGYLEDKIGVAKVIKVSLYFLIIATFLAYIAPETHFPKEIFWSAGILLGFMIGPNQSCSRSLMARLVPKDKQNEFFGFFTFTGKATAAVGPFLFGLIASEYDQQIALLIIIVLFIIGFVLFNNIRFDEKIDFNK